MASPPKVRNLNSLVTEIGSSVRPQIDLINSDIAANDAAGAAQIAGLGARKDTAFKQIEQTAQDKGMFFGGFSSDEQANYTAGTYLPALAQLQQTIAQTRSGLLGKKADINTGVFDKAFATRQGDIGSMNDWNKMNQQQQFQAREARLDRDFRTRESSKDRSAAAANAARSGSGANPTEVLDADRRAIASELSQVTGSDGFVSPRSYSTMRNQWTSAGYDAKTFDSYFKSFRNPYAEDKQNGRARSLKDYRINP